MNRLLRFWMQDSKGAIFSYYYGDESRADRFGQLAFNASRVWEGLASPKPEASTDLVEVGPTTGWNYESLLPRFGGLRDRLDVPLWLLVVHSLAWCCLPGTPLAAQRNIWSKEWGAIGHFTLPYDTGQRQSTIQDCHPKLRARLKSIPPPDYFFSVLPYDLFRCSVLAIDLLLEPYLFGTGIPGGALFSVTPQVSHPSGPQVPSSEVTSKHDDAAPLGIDPIRATSGSQAGVSNEGPSLQGEKFPAHRHRTTKSEAEPKVAAHLNNKPGDSIREVSKATGASIGLISQLDAWKADEPNRRRKGQQVRTRNTSRGTLDLAAIQEDPSEIAVIKEAVETYFLVGVSPGKVAEYKSMGEREKIVELYVFIGEKFSSCKNACLEMGKLLLLAEIENMAKSKEFKILMPSIEQIEEEYGEWKKVSRSRKGL